METDTKQPTREQREQQERHQRSGWRKRQVHEKLPKEEGND